MKRQPHASQPIERLGGVTQKPSSQGDIVPVLNGIRREFAGILRVIFQRILNARGLLHCRAIGGEGSNCNSRGTAELRLFLQKQHRTPLLRRTHRRRQAAAAAAHYDRINCPVHRHAGPASFARGLGSCNPRTWPGHDHRNPARSATPPAAAPRPATGADLQRAAGAPA